MVDFSKNQHKQGMIIWVGDAVYKPILQEDDSWFGKKGAVPIGFFS